MTTAPLPRLDDIVSTLLELVEPDVAADLAGEDPALAVEFHFPPLRCRAIPDRRQSSDTCSVDGSYEAQFDPARPYIFYAADVSPARSRFTVLHELGHHLLMTDAAELLDPIDRLAGTRHAAADVEEAVCHAFAGRLLIPDEVIDKVAAGEQLSPSLVIAVKEATNASWEAVVVRLAGRQVDPRALVLLDAPGRVRFCSASPRLGWARWPRGSRTDPHGPLASALHRQHRAIREIYRYDLGFARAMFCDSVPVASNLAVAVLSDRPSDGHFEVLEDPQPAWRERWLYCDWCGGDRDTDWCDNCGGPHCNECGRCGCGKARVNHPTCSNCGLRSPHRTGAPICLDCEADLA